MGDRSGRACDVGEARRQRRAAEPDHVGLAEVGEDVVFVGQAAGDGPGVVMVDAQVAATTRVVGGGRGRQAERVATAQPEPAELDRLRPDRVDAGLGGHLDATLGADQPEDAGRADEQACDVVAGHEVGTHRELVGGPGSAT